MPSQNHNQGETPIPGAKATTLWGGLLKRRVCVVPTWRGWLLVLILIGLLTTYSFRHLVDFLSDNDPLPHGVIVMEGWVPDYVEETVRTEIRQSDREKIYVTGGPVELGGPLEGYKTLAELSAANLIKMGLSPDMVQAIPAPAVYKDRTYTSAITLRTWFLQHGGIPPKINLISVGPHSRRSRMLFQWAFGKDAQIGVTAVVDRNYDPKHWWRTSEGVRNVTSEFIAYCYARFLFSRSD